MRNSNISRKERSAKHRLCNWAIAGLVLVCWAAPAGAIDPLRMLSQYMRERWGSERGFPGGSVAAIAQTPDGYLWIGTEKGLIRFDGWNFRLFQQASPGAFPIGSVQGLLADAEANLWILLQNAKILRYHDGKFELGREEAEFGVTAISRRRDGAVLFSSLALGTLTYRGGRFESVPFPTGGLPSSTATTKGEAADSGDVRWANVLASACRQCSHVFAEPNSAVISMAETTDGKVWLGTHDEGLFYMSEGRLSAVGKGSLNPKINCLLPLDDGALWIGTEDGVVAWNGTKLTRAGVPAALRHVLAVAMIRDRDANIWVGTPGGLFRVNAEGVARDRSGARTGTPVTALFEDREGNLWVGSPVGLERLRDSAFVTYSVTGRPSESSGPVYVDPQERVWFGPLGGGLHWREGGKTGSVTNDQLSQDVVYSLAGAADELWIGRQRGGLTHLRYAGARVTTQTYTEADGLAQNSVYAVHHSRDGTVWAGTLNGGVSAYRNGHFTTYTTASGMASNTVASIAESADGTMWFATPNGLNAFSGGQWRVFTVREGLPSDNVNCLLSDSTGVLWIGTTSGLAFLRSGGVQVPGGGGPSSLQEQILGMAEDRKGRLWIATTNHVLSANRDTLWGSARGNAEVREYGFEDGLQGMEGVKRHPSVLADRLGRVWFSMNRGLSVVDPTRAVGTAAPVIVQIEGLSADGNASDLKQAIRIPPGGHRVTFSYSGLSLAVPERVRFKYKLDGFDPGWSDPVSTREAVYTNLSSGSYRFRVMASNGDGLWNSSEAALPFSIAPVFWKTWWFQISSVLVVALLILGYIRLRMLTLTQQLNVRFEERLAERTRIAQELHDTLLQGFLSASMQLHVADNYLPPDSPEKPIVGRVLTLMGQVIEEGRNAVHGLRSSKDSSPDLERAFSMVRQEFPVQPQLGFRVIVDGTPLPLHPAIRDEVYRIGHEALSNAFRHSHANDIEVELEYTESHLRVLIRDNGGGIDPQVLRSGRDGHWGLSGMKERTERIGGKLRVLSHAGAGTEVELSVPGSIAFELRPRNLPTGWLSKFYPGKGRNEKSQSGSEQTQ